MKQTKTFDELADLRESLKISMDIIKKADGDTQSLVILAERIKEINDLIEETKETAICACCASTYDIADEPAEVREGGDRICATCWEEKK